MTDTVTLKPVTETKNTHELKNGAWLAHHGCIFFIKNRKVHTAPSDLVHDPKGVVTFDTLLIARAPDSSIPKSWADTWKIQGNSRATWQRITNKQELKAILLPK